MQHLRYFVGQLSRLEYSLLSRSRNFLTVSIAACALTAPLSHARDTQSFTMEAVPNDGTSSRDSDLEQPLLKIAKLLIEVKISGALSETTVIAAISNNTDAELAGRVVLNLPNRASKISYAMDVDGSFAENATIIVKPNKSFRTNVYAFPANGERTFSIRYSAPYDTATGLVFPIEKYFPQTWLFLTVDAREMVIPPIVRLPSGNTLALNQNDIGWRSSFADGLYRWPSGAPITISGGDSRTAHQ